MIMIVLGLIYYCCLKTHVKVPYLAALFKGDFLMDLQDTYEHSLQIKIRVNFSVCFLMLSEASLHITTANLSDSWSKEHFRVCTI